MTEYHSDKKRIIYRIIMLCVLCCPPAAWSATECFFDMGSSLTLRGITSYPVTPLQPGKAGWITGDYKATEKAYTNCNAGNDGQNLNGWSDSTNAPTASISYAGATDTYDIGLFATNIPGIFYAVEIKSDSSPPLGYLPSTTSKRRLYYISDGNDKAYLKKKYHSLYVSLYQTADYIPNGDSTVHPKTVNKIGQFLYGEDTGDKLSIYANTSSFTIPIVLPSCTASLGTQNASGNTVKLGDHSITQLQKNTTSPIPFTINLTNCVNTYKAIIKLSANSYDKNTGYLKNIGSDMGVGLKITNNSNQQLKAGGSSLSWSVSGSSTSLSLNAQLLKLSDTIKTGEFSAQGTFQIDYN